MAEEESKRVVDKMRSLTQKHTNTCIHTLSSIAMLIKLTVLASVKGLYSSRPPGGADRVTCVTEGSYRTERVSGGKNLQLSLEAVYSQNTNCVQLHINWVD